MEVRPRALLLLLLLLACQRVTWLSSHCQHSSLSLQGAALFLCVTCNYLYESYVTYLYERIHITHG